MADTSAATGLTVKQWDAKYFREYLGWNKFAKYMGTSTNSPIQVKKDLTKKQGDAIHFALVNALSGAGVTGDSTLEGNEEAMVSRSHQVSVDQIRNAVRVGRMEAQKSAIPLREAAKGALMDWSMTNFRDAIVAALSDINGVAYGSASEANKDAWLVDNADRALFGALVGNNAANDHSAALATIDNTADKLDVDMINLAVRRAKSASPRIRPIRVREAGDEEWFILLCNSLCFRDLRADTALLQADREARARGITNPLFTGGDLLYNGVIIREIEQIAALSGVGAGSIDVAPNYLLGAQALGVAYAMTSTTAEETFDYGNDKGVAVAEIRGVEKLLFGSGTASDTADLKDHGVSTIFAAAVSDA